MKKLLILTLSWLLAIAAFPIDKKGKITITANVSPQEKGNVKVGVKQVTNGWILMGQARWTWQTNYSYTSESDKSISNFANAYFVKALLTSKGVGIRYEVTATDINGSGYSFYNWTSNDLTNHNNETAFTISGETAYLEDGEKEYTVTANFKKNIDCKETGVEIKLKDGVGSSAPISIELYKAANYATNITRTSGSGSSLVTYSYDKQPIEDSYVGTVALTINAGQGVQSGDEFDVTISGGNGAQHTIHVTIVEDIKVTFNAPTIGGSYTATYGDGSGNFETLSAGGNAVPVSLDHATSFTLIPTPASGYRFYQWVITNSKGNSIYRYDNPYTYSSVNGDAISAEFIEDKYAMFGILGKDVYYNDLNLAIEATGGSGVIYVNKSGLLKRGDYTIPSGITLLIPGDANNTVRNNGLEDSDAQENNSFTPTCHCWLELENNTNISVEGNICIYATVSASVGFNGTPIRYGKMIMGENCHITLKNQSIFSAYGYVQGDHTNSSITAESGATVYELFQFTDWRGGTVTFGGIPEVLESNGGMLNNTEKVFPVGQYFAQNIETKLTIEHGAKEKLSAVAGAAGMNKVLTPVFVSDLNSTNQEGLFLLGDGASVTKYYDKSTDRQKYTVTGSTDDAVAKVSYIYLSVTVRIEQLSMSVTKVLDSRGYVLPITNNMDVSLENIDVTFPYDIGLLGDASIYVDRASNLVLENNLFVYDLDESKNLWYRNSANVTIAPVLHTPDNSQYISSSSTYKRQVDDLPSNANDIPMKDATLLVDGQVHVNGCLYTTASGANITSNGGGKVTFTNIDNKIDGKELYRFIQVAEGSNAAESYLPISVTNAQLHNADGSYSAGASAKAGETYTYVQSLGKWMLPQTLQITNTVGNTFNLTLPNDLPQNVVCDVTGEGITENNFNVQLPDGTKFTKGTISYADGKLTIPLTYQAQNKHNKNNPYTETMTITCTDPTGKSTTEEITLTATEDYTPDFSVTIGGTPIADGGTYTIPTLGRVDKPTPVTVVVSAKENNVTTLATTTWDKTTASPFSFDYGEKAGTAFPNAQLIYRPTTTGTQEGTLTLTASYSDAAGGEPLMKTFTINLSASADLQESTLTLIDDLQAEDGYTLYQSENIDAIFSDMGNKTDISFTFDGEKTHELVTTSKNGENYRLTTNRVANIVEARTITVVATQADNAIMKGNTKTFKVTILPPAIWHWSTLYFGSNTDTQPVTTQGGETWSLVEATDDCGLVTLSGSQNNYTAAIGTPSDLNATCTATFTFTQGDHIETFTSTIYADPRILPYCVDTERTFEDVTTANTTGITFDDNADKLTFAKLAVLELELKGTPDLLTFSPTGPNTWQIEERTSDAAYTPVVNWATLDEGKTVSYQLKPTTRYVKISYGAATETVGTLTNLCISKLALSANMQKVYLPIPGEKTVVLKHADSDIDLIADGLTTTSNTEYIDGYYQTTVTLSATQAGEYELEAQVGDEAILVEVQAYDFPQGLPIRFAEDDAERYHYVTTASSYAHWNASNKQVILENPGGANITRSVTFAFEGAPSIISFDAFSVDGEEVIADSLWTIEESKDGEYFYPAESNLRDSVETNSLEQGLKYTTRYVRVKYSSVLQQEIRLSNLVIEGYPRVITQPEKIYFTTDEYEKNPKQLAVIAINLQTVEFEVDNAAFTINTDTAYAAEEGWSNVINATPSTHPTALGTNKVDTIFLGVKWQKQTALDEGTITIRNKQDNSVLAVISLMGSEGYLVKDQANNTGIYTGIPTDNTFHGTTYTDYNHHQVNLTNAFAEDGTALFDYLIIYGETTPAEGTDITAPKTGGTLIGSNAVTPYIVYKKALNADGKYKGYRFEGKVDNANTPQKSTLTDVIVADTAGTVCIDVRRGTNAPGKLSVYMTGFCPYATTDYRAHQEGVFLFRGKHGDTLDIYLEDFHVSSRNKTENGNAFYGEKQGGSVFSDKYARGSGGVLVFENMDAQEQLQNYTPFEVTIHTIGHNLLNSNYGCFWGLNIGGSIGMKAYQVSSPIHIHMHKADYARKTKTTLNFTDEWPIELNAQNEVVDTKRTNGFLALKKQANNAPSIDMGNKYSTINFLGGRVELQNSQIVSDTYKTTLAISHRSGYFGGDEAGIQLCYGLGTDSVGGTVNFCDGTVTVERMYVNPSYRQYYLMDTLPDGTETEYTTCLRTPKNTFVRGGSICRVRACQHVTSKGGAPKDTETGKMLGQYVYTLQTGKDTQDPMTKLATITGFPDNVEGLKDYYLSRGYDYGTESVTPDNNNQCYFWIPNGFGGVTAEQDKYMSIWKACMTEIRAGIANISGQVGGDIPIETNEEVKYFLYCNLDENIHNVISAGEGEGDAKSYDYKAPIELPSAARPQFNNQQYIRYAPKYVGGSRQHQVLSDTSYTITDRVYYITTTIADIWQTFTAPFDVANIYVVESFSETELEKKGNRTEILQEQAAHNADFAAFFAVAMAMGTNKSFHEIYNSYIDWAKIQDDSLDLYTPGDDYHLRNIQELIPYVGRNWRDANFYLNENRGDWGLTETTDEYGEPIFTFNAQWEMLSANDTIDGILMHKNRTYSLMFPYCTGCEEEISSREAWDYWSGKFIVFESTIGNQTINGRDFLNDTIAGNVFAQNPSADQVIVTGNSTFARLLTNKANVFMYDNGYPSLNNEAFYPILETDTIHPTTAFLYGYVPEHEGMPARRILRTGEIIYGTSGNGTTTGGNMPTVGGGNDLFITSIAGGINIAVAAPQYVRVLSSTGALLFSGMVQTSVDVTLPANGVYVIAGENEVQKILY